MLGLCLLGILLAALIFYYYIFKPMNYWSTRGVEQNNIKWLFGHFWDNVIRKKNGCEVLEDTYKQKPNSRYFGTYRFTTPIFMVRDPELIKQITIKDFDFFTDHVEFLPPESDPLWSKNLLNLTGSKWHDTRALLSPSFTSAKMRTIFVPMEECAESLVKHLQKRSEATLSLDVKDVFSRYTNDVIATTAFGVKVDSLSEPKNEFYRTSKYVADFATFWKTLKLLTYWLVPFVKNFMKVQIIDDNSGAFFRGLIDDTIRVREEKGIVRQDMLHLLLQTRNNLRKEQADTNIDKKQKGTVKEKTSSKTLDLSNEDITAHAVIFIMAGFESVSSFISFTAYELAVNPDVQEKLRKEIRATKEKCNGKVTYEAILEMNYMDMVVSESMRKWPHFVAMNRVCTKPYTIEPTTPNEKPVHLEKGTQVVIPVSAIQHDPKYYPNPERFDPERFSEENKSQIQPYTYLPFGMGPRICIGNRFTLLETKILLFHLLSGFELVPVEKTKIPLVFEKSTVINLKPVGGFWLGFKRCTE